MSRRFGSVKVLESRVLYEKYGRVVVEDLLEYADGSRQEYVYFRGSGAAGPFPGAVAVAAITEDTKMILTRQYRHPMRGLVYDLPAGGMKNGETSEQAALRELREETGYTSKGLQWIGRFNWNPSITSGTVEIFFTKNLRRKGAFDRNEIADIELMDFAQVKGKVLSGELIDSALVIATLLIEEKGLLSRE